MLDAKARSSLRLLVLLAFALIAVTPSPSLAQRSRSRSASAQKVESIRRAMERGQALFASGRYAEAAQVFEQGYREHPYSAFLFNAGVAYQRLNDPAKALAQFLEYIRVDPNAPDVDRVQQRIATLQAQLDAERQPAAEQPSDAPAKPAAEPDADVMKGLILIETDPAGAPLAIYRKTSDQAGAYEIGEKNPGWTLVGRYEAPANLTLDVGRYHIVVEPFRAFNASEADIDVSAGRVLQFKANLSQGAFMAFLRVTSNVEGATIFVDDPQERRTPWGNTPYGELVGAGRHEVRVVAPGFKPIVKTVDLERGGQEEIHFALERVDYGIVRLDADAAAIDVVVDGKPVGTWRSSQPPLELTLPAGRHHVVIRSTGRKTFDGELHVPKGRVLPVHARLIPRYPRGAAWAQAIIGGATLGGSIYLGVESNRLHDAARDDRARGVLTNDDPRVDRGRWFAVGANAGFVLSAGFAALATYNFLRDPYPASRLVEDVAVDFPKRSKRANTTAPSGPRAPAGKPRPPADKRRPPSGWLPSPQLGEASVGLSWGGRF